jgi:hypothetical protein
MLTSGITAIATTADDAVDVLANPNGLQITRVRIANVGASPAAGFYSLDGGTLWHYMPTGVTDLDLTTRPGKYTVKVKRIPSGTNLDDVYASAW